MFCSTINDSAYCPSLDPCLFVRSQVHVPCRLVDGRSEQDGEGREVVAEGGGTTECITAGLFGNGQTNAILLGCWLAQFLGSSHPHSGALLGLPCAATRGPRSSLCVWRGGLLSEPADMVSVGLYLRHPTIR